MPPQTSRSGLSPILALQRSAGNQAVAALLSRGPSSGADGRGVDDGEQGSDNRPSLQRDGNDGALTGGSIGAKIGGWAGQLIGTLTGTGAAEGAARGARLGGQAGGAIGTALTGGSGCPVPVAVLNGPTHSPINTADAAGMAIAISLVSSSGKDADMAKVQDSEQVSSSLNHTGSYSAVAPGRSNNSGYMAGHPVPADRHSEAKAQIIDCADNHGGNGAMDRQQLDSFTAPDCGITTPQAIPNSGYLIRRRILVDGTKIIFRLEKSPSGCTVNGFTSSAGPSPFQFEEVVVRP